MPKPAPEPVPLTDAQRETAAAHAGWAFGGVRTWFRDYPWLEEELRGAVYDGLFAAVREFEPGRDAKLRTFITVCVRRSCGAALKASRCQKRYCPKAVPFPIDDHAHEVAEDRAAPPDYDGRPDPRRFEWLLDALDPVNAAVVRGRLRDGLYWRDIGRALGISHEGARNRYAAAIETLRSDPYARRLAP